MAQFTDTECTNVHFMCDCVIEKLELHEGKAGIGIQFGGYPAHVYSTTLQAEANRCIHITYVGCGRCNVQTEEKVLGAIDANLLTNILRFNMK